MPEVREQGNKYMDSIEGRTMISNETWGGMIAMGLRYHVHCERCDRFAEVAMTKLPPDGKALNRTFRCSQCGAEGRSVVSSRSADRAAYPARPLPIGHLSGKDAMHPVSLETLEAYSEREK